MRSTLIVGCGSIGERHLRCFQQTGRTSVAACDASTALLDRLAVDYKVPTFTRFEEALQGAADIVVICTPAHLHVPMAIQALKSGKHVLIEKPLSQSLQNVDALIRAHAESARQVSVAYVLHVFPFLVEARKFLRDGSAGAIKHVTLTSGQHFPAMRPAHTVHYSKTYYRDRKMGGGAIQDALTHTVNWVESVIGATDSVLCDCSHQVLPEVTVEDTVNVSTRNGDVLVNYSLNQFQAPNEATLQFNGTAGSVKIEFHRQRWGSLQLGESDWTWREAAVPARDSHFIAQANAFLDQVEGKPSRLCSLAAAAQTLRFNLAALESAEKSARVHCASLSA